MWKRGICMVVGMHGGEACVTEEGDICGGGGGHMW